MKWYNMSELEKIKEKIKPVAEKYNHLVHMQRKDSDIDIIVRTEDVVGWIHSLPYFYIKKVCVFMVHIRLHV